MTAEQFRREKLYQTALTIAKTMLERGLITAAEYSSIDTILREKYAPSLGTLQPVQAPKNPIKHLTNAALRVIIQHNIRRRECKLQ
jgi:hypothetical protein